MSSKSILNLSFCGTQLSATRKGQATVEALKKFDNHLILSGVGSKSTQDDKGHYYPTPGTFSAEMDAKGTLVCEKRALRVSENMFIGPLGAGLIHGSGESDNIEWAMKNLDKEMEKNNERPLVVNLSGFSRGGASAIRFANEAFQKYGHEIQFNLFLVDPTGGIGRLHSPRKINIPPNVNAIHFSFNQDEKNWKYEVPDLSQYIFANPETKITAISISGNHLDQEIQFKDKQTNEWKWKNAGEINHLLAEQFMIHHGGRVAEGNNVVKKGEHFSQFIDGLMQEKNKEHIRLISAYEPKKIEVQSHLKELSNKIKFECSPEKKRLYLDLQYHLYQFYCEIERERNRLLQSTSHAYLKLINFDRPLKAAEDLIKAICHKEGDINLCLEKFHQSTHIKTMPDHIKNIAATIVSLVVGLVVGIGCSLGGFVGGMMRWREGSIPAFPVAMHGFFNGAAKGYEWAKRNMMGQVNARALSDTVEKISAEEKEEAKIEVVVFQ